MDTILLVNDSSTLTKLLTNHFQKGGYRVVPATCAMEAYEAFIRNDPHLVLTDHVLRDKDGFEVIRTFRTRKAGHALPIVVFTSNDDAATMQKCKDAGASLVLSKAGGTGQLLQQIEKLVEDYKANQPGKSLDNDMGHCIVKATNDVFRMMMNLKVVPGEPAVQKAQTRTAEVIASIGVVGFLSGSISMFLPKALAQKACGAMLMLEPGTVVPDGELVDAIGELINMVGGGIKTELFQKMPLFDISVPSVCIGDSVQRRSVGDDLCFLVPFTIDGMQFQVEFLMVTKKEGGTGVQQSVLNGSSST